jgi:hypothetical protein
VVQCLQHPPPLDGGAVGGINIVGIGVLVRTTGRKVRVGVLVAPRTSVALILVTSCVIVLVTVGGSVSSAIEVTVQVAVAGSKMIAVGEDGLTIASVGLFFRVGSAVGAVSCVETS